MGERPPIAFGYKKLQSGTPNLCHTALAVPDPDLEIRKGAGGSSRPLDKGGGGEPSLPKKFCRPFGPQFGLKIRGEGRGPWAPPLDRHCLGPHFFPSNWLMLYSNGFSVELSSFEANIEKERGKEVERNMSTLVIQLTQVLMPRIVAGL